MKAILKCFLASLPLVLSGCATPTRFDQSITFNDLPGWEEQHLSSIKPALLQSCEKLNKKTFSSESLWGGISTWQRLCQELARTPDRQLIFFFENNFKPVAVSPNERGLFTGYYSPVIPGQTRVSEEFQTPLLKLPENLVKVLPSDFNREGSMMVGKVKQGYLKPYDQRASINKQKPVDDEVLLWLKDPVDRYFLQIQGSGSVELENGDIVHVVYAGNNGHDYVSIGRILRDEGELEDVSTETIKKWLEDNPDKQEWLFNHNPRYIFFNQSDTGAITAQGVPATTNRTLAVDPGIIPLGVPVWLDTTITATNEPFRQLMVAQDTGSAIKGAVRGDIYMGLGDEAGHLAGEQQAPGKLYMLVPR